MGRQGGTLVFPESISLFTFSLDPIIVPLFGIYRSFPVHFTFQIEKKYISDVLSLSLKMF